MTIVDFVRNNYQKWGQWKEFFDTPKVWKCLTNISQAIDKEIRETSVVISPPVDEIFKAFIKTDVKDIKAVILGQDPAPEPHLADGLAFCVQGVSTAHVPSIQRMLLEVRNEGFNVDILNGNIESWAERGVLLLNTVLTIPIPKDADSGIIDAHKKYWMPFSKLLFEFLHKLNQPIVYILWGSQAHHFAHGITNPKHKVLEGGHPSPQARSENFFCKDYFVNTNNFLQESGVKSIDWSLLPGKLDPKVQKGIWHWSSKDKHSIWKEPCPGNKKKSLVNQKD